MKIERVWIDGPDGPLGAHRLAVRLLDEKPEDPSLPFREFSMDFIPSRLTDATFAEMLREFAYSIDPGKPD